ncbi:MAG TPA: redoxin domain-containing protein [Thermoguttaceae bacterium]|nr:redoxin domain-containing protein [Thermoguttaceae bacterium]
MRSSERQTGSVRRVLFTCLMIAWVGTGLTCWVGCRQADTPGTPETEPSGEPLAGTGQAAPGEQPTTPLGESATTAGPQLSAREVLDRMVAAYKSASSYDDKGYLQVRYQLGGQPRGLDVNFGVALARPNKVRVHAFDGLVVCDGQKLWGAARNMPDQVLCLDAPPEITIESLYPNHVVADAMIREPTRTFSWLPVQLILLLADDPLKTLLHESAEPQTIEPGMVGERACHRIRIQRPDGVGGLWIDQETYVLRRFEFPAEILRMLVAEQERVPRNDIQNLLLMAELAEAKFGGEIDPEAFQFQAPSEVKPVEDFLPGDIGWLGQKVPEFSFVPLDGDPITPKSLSGKIAVLDFWATWCQPCRMTLPDLEEVYQKYKDNEKVAFVAVSVDKPDVTDQQLRDTFSEIGVNVPIARYPDQTAFETLDVQAYPTQLVLGAEGVVQHRQSGGDQPGLGAARLSARLERLLAGEDLHQESVEQYQQARGAGKKRFAEMLQTCVKDDLYVLPQPEVPKAEIAPRAEPKSLKLTPLWSCTELAAPGNILVLERAEQPPRLLVLEQANSIAEIATEGNVVSVKPLGVPPQEPVFFLRTGVGDDQRRYFVGSSLGVQQVHLWDEDFKLLRSFPEDAPQNPHTGIADVRIADLDGDGTLELAVSYLGVVGVQGVSLEGERTWSNKSVVQSMRMVVLGPDAEGQRQLLAINSARPPQGALVKLDAQGQPKGEFSFDDRVIAWLGAEDLNGDGQPELCALTALPEGKLEAIGFDLEGKKLWSYALPRGIHEHQIEAVTSGKLLPDQPDQWLLAAADGTIHILDAEGGPIDVFAYGKVLTGVGAAQWDGKRVLLVATPEGLDAWQVEPAPSP